MIYEINSLRSKKSLKVNMLYCKTSLKMQNKYLCNMEMFSFI